MSAAPRQVPSLPTRPDSSLFTDEQSVSGINGKEIQQAAPERISSAGSHLVQVPTAISEQGAPTVENTESQGEPLVL